MKRTCIILLLSVLGIAAMAGECLVLKKTGGTYVYTNGFDRFSMANVAFTLPSNTTNTFTVAVQKSVIERTLVGSKVTTNLWGRVVTNIDYGVTSETNVVIDTLLLTASTTNVTSSQVYCDTSDPALPGDFIVDEGDRIVFTWSDFEDDLYFLVHKE